jgi:Thiamine monophosphate synthase
MIIAATDRNISAFRFKEQLSLIAKAKPDVIILTERDLSQEEYKELASFCFEECEKNDVVFCIDKFVDIAKELGIKTIHFDMEDLAAPVTEGFDTVLVTVRSDKEAQRAEALGATMLIFREVFDISCKSCRNAKGLATLRFTLGAVDIPIIGAGGILPDVFLEVLSVEAAGVCMKSGFMRAKDPAVVVNSYRDAERRIEARR